MNSYEVFQVDSFTRTKLRGNPAGVVPFADGLTDQQMQDIARELNNSETAFIFNNHHEDIDGQHYDVEVRFFTPTTEVPLCGHATIAAHYVRALKGLHQRGRIIQKTKAGLLPVDVTPDGDDFRITMTQSTPEVSAPLSEELICDIAQALGIKRGDVRKDCPVAIASAGHAKVMVALKGEQLLNSLTPDAAQLTAISKRIGCNGYYVFTLDENPTDEQPYLAHGRMFAPAIGIAEDPVTGNANGPLGVYLTHFGLCSHLYEGDTFDLRIVQGEAIKRAGTMDVHVEMAHDAPVRAQITGEAVVAFRTEMTL